MLAQYGIDELWSACGDIDSYEHVFRQFPGSQGGNGKREPFCGIGIIKFALQCLKCVAEQSAHPLNLPGGRVAEGAQYVSPKRLVFVPYNSTAFCAEFMGERIGRGKPSNGGQSKSYPDYRSYPRRFLADSPGL